MADQEWSFAHHFADSTDPRVARLDPDESQRCFLGWIGAPQRATDRRVIALDGKALRRSSDRAKGESPLHSAHAWATANHRLRGPVAGDEESDGITALAESLRMLGLSGAIVTIDALGCQEEIARPLRGGGADDVRRRTAGGPGGTRP